MTRGEITGRVDVNFWRLTPLFHELFRHPCFPAVPIGTVVELVQYGCSSLASEQPVGVPMLRMNNLQNDGWDLSDLKYIQMSEDDLVRYRLEPGDLLFNRTNSKELVGKCEVFNEPGDWVFASYLIRVRLDARKALPRFAADFLSTRAGRLQIDRLSRQIIGMTNINAEELQEILLPLPPDTKMQTKLVATMDAARAKRRAKLAEADALLVGLDGFVLANLGLTQPPQDDRKVFAVRRSDVEQRTIGVSLYAPPLRRFLRALATGRYRTPKLRDVVALNPAVDTSKLTPQSAVSFVPMEAVAEAAEGTVRLQTRSVAEVQKGYTPFAEGDVLWAKITPCMENGKSCVVSGLTNGVGFGSTEFHVLRPRTDEITAEYIHTFLSLVSLRRVARLAFTGSAGQQRVPEDFLGDLPFPVPPPTIRQAITAEARRRREEARRLRAEAEADWQAAKQWFEDQLLGTALP